MGRKNYAIICVVTRRKLHSVIGAIITRKRRVTKAIILEMREIRRILGENELCVYNRNSFSFVFVRFRSICDVTYHGNRREKKVICTLCHSFRLQTCK